MSKYFPSYGGSNGSIEVKLDLSNYATKTDLNNISHTDTSNFVLRSNLALLKTEVDKIDTDKLKTVPDDFAKLSNVVKNDVVKKVDYDKKIRELSDDVPDVSNLASKSSITTLVIDLQDKIDKIDTSTLASKASLNNYILTTTFNSKSAEIEGKIQANADSVAKNILSINKIDTNLDGFKKSDLSGYAKKSEVASDYVTNTSLTSKLDELKSQHL